MSFATQGAAPIFGSAGITFTIYDQAGTTLGSGFVMPTVSGFNLTHNGEVARTKNASGDVDAVTGSGEFIECAFTLLPTGTSAANALKSSLLPPLMSTVVISGAKVIRVGPFTDAINVAGGSAPENSRWIYEGGGSVQFSSEGHATLNVTLRRYPGIVGGAAITS